MIDYDHGCELGRETTYNGWKNYPTWAVNLWPANDEGLYEEAAERVKAGRWSGGPNHERAHVADAFESWVRNELVPDLGASFAADLLGYALSEVDWYEIADAWIFDSAVNEVQS